MPPARRGFLKRQGIFMHKTSKRRRKNQHKLYVTGMIVAAVILCAALTMMLLAHFGIFSGKDSGVQDNGLGRIDLHQEKTESLGYGLRLEAVGRYAGLYIEDGTNDTVSDVMMIKVKNTADKDLQLARISLTYSDFTAEFELTNIPAGRTVVVLEKNRHAYSDQNYLSFQLSDVAQFSEQMDVPTEIYHISGLKGTINLENRSDKDISGDIYVYYKYIADDILYGGITFRAKISGGISAGQIKQVASSHFDPQQCIVLAITDGA